MKVTQNPLSFRGFIDYMAGHLHDREHAEEYVRSEYLSGPSQFMSECRSADTRLRDSLDKLGLLFDWILEESSERGVPAVPLWEFGVFVDSFLKDQTEILVVLGDRVILREFWNPSQFWWSNEGEFEHWANKALQAILDRLHSLAWSTPQK